MPRQINFIAVTMTPSAGRTRTLLMRRFLEVCALCVFMLIGAGTLAAHPADPAPAPTTSPTTGPAADRAPSQSSLQSGIAAAEAGRLSEAITILTPHAKRGNATANYTLGLIYMRGTGDAATAARLSHRHFKNAAQRGHVGAVFEVAFQFERGIGTERDVKRAIRLYRLAAQSNHLNAQYNLAVLLSNGGGVEPDLPQAYFWAKAAHHNAIRSPNPVLTESRTRGLARTIRARLPYQQASKASTAAARLTGQPI